MKKIILTLFVCLSCIMVANARRETPSVVDTLAKRVISGLEIIPIRKTYESGKIFWKLRISNFKECFQRFESKYPGGVNYNLNTEDVNRAIYDWEDKIWGTIVSAEIRALEDFVVKLFVDKDGRIFTAEFSMWDETFQKLGELPKNTLKNLHHDLIKEECKAFKEVDFQVLDIDDIEDRQTILDVCGSLGSGNEYTIIGLNRFCYDVFGTFYPRKLPEEERCRLLKKKEAEMNSRKKEE